MATANQPRAYYVDLTTNTVIEIDDLQNYADLQWHFVSFRADNPIHKVLTYKFIYKLKRAVARRHVREKMSHKKDYKFCMAEIEMRPQFGQEFFKLQAEFTN